MRRRRHATGRAGTAGFTLVELVAAAALLALVLGSVALVADSSDRMFRLETVTSHLESRIAIVTEQVFEELRIAGADTIAPALVPGVGVSSIEYVQAVDVAGGQAVWTPLRRLAFEYESGELDDGLDNNGNGLVDEGRLVLTEDVGGPDERSRVLTHWVAELLEGEVANGLDDNGNGLIDEPGFTLEQLGETLFVRLTLARRTGEGRMLVRTAMTSIRPRNRMGSQG